MLGHLSEEPVPVALLLTLCPREWRNLKPDHYSRATAEEVTSPLSPLPCVMIGKCACHSVLCLPYPVHQPPSSDPHKVLEENGGKAWHTGDT